MASDYDLDLAGEFVLALMAFEIHDGGRAWKGFPWEVLARLHEKGLISDPRTKAKSVVLSEEGEAQALAAHERFLCVKANSPSAPIGLAQAGTGGPINGFTDIQQRQINNLLEPICVPASDPAVRSKLRHGYRADGLSVILYASRPAFRPPHEWQDDPIAKFTYVKKTRRWKLF